MKNYKSLAKDIKKLDKSTSIGIFSHVSCDPDGVFSAFAIAKGLGTLGFFNITVFMDKSDIELVNNALKWAANVVVSYESDRDIAVAFVLDLSRDDRLGKYARLVNSASKIYVIDHHPNPTINSTISVINTELSSCGEVLFNVLKHMKVKLNKDIATLLYVAIMADSQYLTVSISYGNIFMVIKELMTHKVNTADATSIINQKLTTNEMQVVANALLNVKTVGIVTIYTIDAKDLSIDYDKIKSKALSIFSKTSDLKILLVMVVMNRGVQGSLRSYCDEDVNLLAEKLNGGGHKKASGFDTTLTRDKVLEIVENFYK